MYGKMYVSVLLSNLSHILLPLMYSQVYSSFFFFLIHSPTECRLGCFQFLSIINKAVKRREPSLVLCDICKGGGEGGTRVRLYMCTCSWFTLLYGRNQHDTVKNKEQKKLNKTVINNCGLVFWGHSFHLLWVERNVIIKLYGKIILVL